MGVIEFSGHKYKQITSMQALGIIISNTNTVYGQVGYDEPVELESIKDWTSLQDHDGIFLTRVTRYI